MLNQRGESFRPGKLQHDNIKENWTKTKQGLINHDLLRKTWSYSTSQKVCNKRFCLCYCIYVHCWTNNKFPVKINILLQSFNRLNVANTMPYVGLSFLSPNFLSALFSFVVNCQALTPCLSSHQECTIPQQKKKDDPKMYGDQTRT